MSTKHHDPSTEGKALDSNADGLGLMTTETEFPEADLWPAGNPSWSMISELPVVNRLSSQVFRHAV
jgi:hypothetical protein